MTIIRCTRVWALACVLALGATAQAGAPYELATGREAALVTGGLGLVFTSLAIRDDAPLTAPPSILDRQHLRWFDRPAASRWSPGAAQASDVVVTGLMLSPFALAALDEDAGWTTAAMQAESLLLTGGAVAVLKAAVGRSRPHTYNPDARIPAPERARRFATRSFPSGHAATAFASAMLLGEVYAELNPDDDARHWVRYGSLAGAAGVSYLRYAAGVHFPSDIVAGAAIGTIVGWAVPRLHEASGNDGDASPTAGFVLGFGF